MFTYLCTDPQYTTKKFPAFKLPVSRQKSLPVPTAVVYAPRCGIFLLTAVPFFKKIPVPKAFGRKKQGFLPQNVKGRPIFVTYHGTDQ
jgi:hypothetical protein